MPKDDLSHWLTKQQAADAIGVSTKTIEKLADNRQLQQRSRKRPGKPAIVVYHPSDVERVRLERNPDAEPFELPADRPAAPPGTALTVPAAELSAASQNSQNSQNPNPLEFLAALAAGIVRQTDRGPVAPERRYLTLAEAAAYTGLGEAYLRQNCESWPIGPHRRLVFRRADLDKL